MNGEMNAHQIQVYYSSLLGRKDVKIPHYIWYFLIKILKQI